MKSEREMVRVPFRGASVRIGFDGDGEKLIIARDLAMACGVNVASGWMTRSWGWADVRAVYSNGACTAYKVLRASELEKALESLPGFKDEVEQWFAEKVLPLGECAPDEVRCGLVELPPSIDIDTIKAIIPIGQANVGDDEVNSVNARDLHEALGVGKHFRSWIKDRIEQCQLIENVDYVRFSPDSGETGGRPSSSPSMPRSTWP